ncbi:MAG: hypothetical protein ABEJ03_01150, partial [Candidatus Nanohaloarchaea archaeon]
MNEENANLLDHNYHDSYLRGVEETDNKTTLVIDTDIHWHPGKPFTLITLVNADDKTRIEELVGGDENASMSIEEAVINRSDRSDRNFKLEIEFHSGANLEVRCYNFWTERVEEYRDYS